MQANKEPGKSGLTRWGFRSHVCCSGGKTATKRISHPDFDCGGGGRYAVDFLSDLAAAHLHTARARSPNRDLVTRVTFEVEDETETKALRERQRRDQLAFYSNRKKLLLDLQAALRESAVPGSGCSRL